MNATLAAIIVFNLIVALQGYWVVCKRFRDLAQRQDAKHQELILKIALMSDGLARIEQRLNIALDCAPLDEDQPAKVKPTSARAIELARQCALNTQCGEEQACMQLDQRPIARDQKGLAEQVSAVMSVLADWYTISAWLGAGGEWRARLNERINGPRARPNRAPKRQQRRPNKCRLGSADSRKGELHPSSKPRLPKLSKRDSAS